MEDIPQKSFRLTQHELTIHLIASGLVRLSEQVQRGEPIAYPYPVALQQGLNRLLVKRYLIGTGGLRSARLVSSSHSLLGVRS